MCVFTPGPITKLFVFALNYVGFPPSDFPLQKSVCVFITAVPITKTFGTLLCWFFGAKTVLGKRVPQLGDHEIFSFPKRLGVEFNLTEQFVNDVLGFVGPVA